ncbi:MAG: alcohol dehydrogenase catalytic domain-containing protein, partial [Planctomycetia bacterium]|nr:alcohol dehydrogenase catalytic domain-containing protein [Planctomycetia bacterium]
MKALIWHSGLNFAIEDIPRPEAEPGRIVVKVEASAICGTDLHTADFGIKGPLVLGHEVGGTVFEIGSGVKGLRVGMRV